MGRVWSLGFGSSKRYYGGRTADEAVNDAENARAALLESMDATPEKIEGAKRILHLTGHDRAPDQRATGRQAAGVIQGEGVIVTETVKNAHGELVTEAYRRNGPHMERIRIRESEAGPNSRIVTEIFGRRT